MNVSLGFIPPVDADEVHLQQVVINLIANAHDGRIFAENNKCAPGATVSFELPLASGSTSHIRTPEPQRGKY